jgi:hypothetical protein
VTRKCAFCLADTVETGGEHIWDDWINKALPPTKYRSRKRYTLTSPTIEADTDSLREKLPVVCSGCNNGWMSVLSEKVKERFGRSMLDGDPFSLGPRDAAILASFTFMKAVVTNHLIGHHDGAEPFFTRAARERFGTSHVLPPLLKCWFGAFQGESRMSTRNNLSIIGTSEPGPLCGMEFCSFTYVVGKLALQLVAPRWKHIYRRGGPLISLSPNVYWEKAATLFWPNSGVRLSWSPPEYMADDTIRAFIYRFNNPVTIPVQRSERS